MAIGLLSGSPSTLWYTTLLSSLVPIQAQRHARTGDGRDTPQRFGGRPRWRRIAGGRGKGSLIANSASRGRCSSTRDPGNSKPPARDFVVLVARGVRWLRTPVPPTLELGGVRASRSDPAHLVPDRELLERRRRAPRSGDGRGPLRRWRKPSCVVVTLCWALLCGPLDAATPRGGRHEEQVTGIERSDLPPVDRER